jgi:ATP/maltotriose-dependent transcriptional regulator MalT
LIFYSVSSASTSLPVFAPSKSISSVSGKSLPCTTCSRETRLPSGSQPTGQIQQAADALDRLAEATGVSQTDWGLGMYARCRALLRDGQDAEDSYREAVDRLSRTGFRTELARAYLLYGEWLRRQGRRADARAELRTAHGMFAAIGMEAFAERARQELAATGETVRKRTTTGTRDQLTPQEAPIAQLAREGLSNPEIAGQLFLSARTVEWHLRKVFTKLDISSRRQLRQALPDGATAGQVIPAGQRPRAGTVASCAQDDAGRHRAQDS